MADEQTYSATSQSGELSEALRGAVDAASRDLNADFFTWRLESIAGSFGGFVGAHDVTVTISAAPPRALAKGQTAAASQCGSWYAWHDRMPGTRPTLHVVGQCVFPTGGYTVELRRVEGFNPAIYVLEKIVHEPKPGDVVTQQVNTVNIHYREETSGVYTSVSIRPDNVTIDVHEVS
jgi:hypothetical protein